MVNKDLWLGQAYEFSLFNEKYIHDVAYSIQASNALDVCCALPYAPCCAICHRVPVL